MGLQTRKPWAVFASPSISERGSESRFPSSSENWWLCGFRQCSKLGRAYDAFDKKDKKIVNSYWELSLCQTGKFYTHTHTIYSSYKTYGVALLLAIFYKWENCINLHKLSNCPTIWDCKQYEPRSPWFSLLCPPLLGDRGRAGCRTSPPSCGIEGGTTAAPRLGLTKPCPVLTDNTVHQRVPLQ